MIEGDYNRLVYRVTTADKTIRQILFEDMAISSRLYRQLKRRAAISVNGNIISLNAKARRGDVIAVALPEAPHRISAQSIAIDVLYEDRDIVAVNKQVGIVAHPTRGVADGTLANALCYYAEQRGQNYKPRLINRLDRDTSGIILFAKNPYAQNIVSQEFIAGRVKKYYLALLHGKFNKKTGTINQPIGLAENSQIKRTVRADGKAALTHYQVLEQLSNVALVKLQIETGRTHQIRVHSQFIGHPVVGDDLYGSYERIAIARQALHAAEMTFRTPRSGQVNITAPLPDDIVRAMRILK